MGLKSFLHWLNEKEETRETQLLEAIAKANEFEDSTSSEVNANATVQELEKFIIKGSNLPKLKDIKKAG